MGQLSRRSMIAGAAAWGAFHREAQAQTQRDFIAAAFEARRQAIAAGDQPYGAVVVLADKVVGFGPSRVVVTRNNDAHAEREAIRDAQARLGRSDLAGAILYSTSRPCALCEAAAARAGIARMLHGEEPTDAGAPRL